MEVNGFDYFDPKACELVSGGKSKIALFTDETGTMVLSIPFPDDFGCREELQVNASPQAALVAADI